MRSTRIWLCLVALVVVAACSAQPRSAAPISKIRVVDDRHIDVTYIHASCADAAGHDLHYATDTITITMYDRPSDKCAFGGIGEATQSVTLKEPISGRRFIDQACETDHPPSGSSICPFEFVSD